MTPTTQRSKTTCEIGFFDAIATGENIFFQAHIHY
jgi:hypothetical protein